MLAPEFPAEGLKNYRKKTVDAYIEALVDDYEAALEEKDTALKAAEANAARLSARVKELQSGNNELTAKVMQLEQDKAKAAELLAGAETTAASIIAQARKSAEQEKKELAENLAKQRDELEIRTRAISDMKADTRAACDKAKAALEQLYKDFGERIEETLRLTDEEFDSIKREE